MTGEPFVQVTLRDHDPALQGQPQRDDPLDAAPLADLDRAPGAGRRLVEVTAVECELRVREGDEPVLRGVGHRPYVPPGAPQPPHAHRGFPGVEVLPEQPPGRAGRGSVLTGVQEPAVRLPTGDRRLVEATRQPGRVSQRLQVRGVQRGGIQPAQPVVGVCPGGTTVHGEKSRTGQRAAVTRQGSPPRRRPGMVTRPHLISNSPLPCSLVDQRAGELGT